MTAILDVLIQGTLTGGLYALFAAGLSLIFGVMRLVNIAHGDFIVLAAYLALALVAVTGINPLLLAPLVVLAMAAIGYGVQRTLFNKTLGADPLPPLLVSFGLSVILQNGLLALASGDSRRLQAGAIETAALSLPGDMSVGWLPVLTFGVAVAVIAALQWLFYHAPIGRVFRAASDDQDTVRLLGANNRHVYGLAMALAMAVVGIAGVLLAIRTNFDPAVGPGRLIFAFETVIIGGLGSLWGTLAGGVVLGIAQAAGARIDPGWQALAGHLVFLLVLLFRPQGLFPASRA